MTSPRVIDTGIVLRPDSSRVLTRLFVPGREDVGPGDSRAAPVIERLLALSEADVVEAVAVVERTLAARHGNARELIGHNADQVASRIDEVAALSDDRRFLLGACFTHEYAVEAAALCNPSIVAFPAPQADGAPSGDAPHGALRFILSVRGIGEGHRSSIGFRTGTVDDGGRVTVDEPDPALVCSSREPGVHHRAVAHMQLAEVGDDAENAAYVLDRLPATFSDVELDAAIEALVTDGATRRDIASTIGHLRDHGLSSYTARFPAATDVSSRVLWPAAPQESQGMEDARFVRFLDDDGTVTYYATYTAWDGVTVSQHLLETTDFLTFQASPVAGTAATGKGLAIFPRKVGGRYVAMSRSDRESNAVAFTDDLRCWPDRHVVQLPARPWELLQLGNCGSPIETSAGWLVLTHGVGALRTYHLGAILLDIDDPTRVIAHSRDPILSPTGPRQDGYVPNVVYTCGALAHGDTLVLPYGIGDQAIGIATLSISELLASLTPEG